MDKYMIDGGRRLYGTVKIQSAKNSVLPLFAASILTDTGNARDNRRALHGANPARIGRGSALSR